MAYNSKNLAEDMEALPYKLVDADNSPYWDNIYREREIIRERTRLAMGMSLRPEDEPIPVSQGVEESNIDEKYYEPPLMQVISSACNACPENRYEVTDKCMGIPVMRYVPVVRLPCRMVILSSTRPNVSSVVNAKPYVLMMPFPISKDPVWLTVE